MQTKRSATSEKVVFLFTTFPVPTETFLQREIRVYHEQGLNFRIVSLWGGDSYWEGLPIVREGLCTSLAGILWIPYFLYKKPRIFLKFLRAVIFPRRSGLLNWGENLLGAGYALSRAGQWQREKVTHFHAVWASAPAMAAWFLSELTDIPFSFAGHAYDLFENGGDGWLSGKMQAASWMRTSTMTGKARLLELGADPSRILVVRRGLDPLPTIQDKPDIQPPVRFLSVGRMVEKMGYHRQIPLIRELLDSGLSLSVDWIGDGPERASLEKLIRQNDLEGTINLHGHVDYPFVEQAYQRCDCLLFTGTVSRNGDRAGLPNVVAEAMAWGLLVFSTRVGAVEEAVQHQQTGILWTGEPEAESVILAIQDPSLVSDCRGSARNWIEKKFDLSKNLCPLVDCLRTATFPAQEG